VQSRKVPESRPFASRPSVIENIAFKPCVLMVANFQYDRTTPLINVPCTLVCNFSEKNLDLVLGPNGKDTSDKLILFDRQLVSFVEPLRVPFRSSVQWKDYANSAIVSEEAIRLDQIESYSAVSSISTISATGETFASGLGMIYVFLNHSE
jgi:hypothetical protein